MKFFTKGLLLGCISFVLCSPTFALGDTITIAGTGDSQHLLRQLAQAFQQKHPDHQILIPNSVGSGGGIKLLMAGRSELARTARPLKPKEQAEGLQERIFAYSPVVFVANLPEKCIDNITEKRYLAMLRGEITNWEQLGSCPDQKIYIANREEGDSSKLVLEQNIAGLKDLQQPAGRIIYSTPETYDTLSHYKYSFGYLPMSQILKDTLTLFNFNGVAPTNKNIQQGKYRLVVPLAIVWRDQPSGLTKQFLDYLFSAEARDLLVKLKTVPAAE